MSFAFGERVNWSLVSIKVYIPPYGVQRCFLNGSGRRVLQDVRRCESTIMATGSLCCVEILRFESPRRSYKQLGIQKNVFWWLFAEVRKLILLM